MSSTRSGVTKKQAEALVKLSKKKGGFIKIKKVTKS